MACKELKRTVAILFVSLAIISQKLYCSIELFHLALANRAYMLEYFYRSAYAYKIVYLLQYAFIYLFYFTFSLHVQLMLYIFFNFFSQLLVLISRSKSDGSKANLSKCFYKYLWLNISAFANGGNCIAHE